MIRILPISIIAAVVFAALPVAANMNNSNDSWSPAASERLIKLPGNYLKRAVEHDFAKSGLAAALQDTESLIQLKNQTLGDLQGAVEVADGDLRIELQHQFLAEKRSYLELVARHQDLRRRQTATKIRLYERLLNRMGIDKMELTPQRVALINMQENARQRFRSSIDQVDMKLFQSVATTESKYAREYAKNLNAIERLVQAVNIHPMNAQSKIDGQPVSKDDYLRQLISESQAELATVEQEGTVLAYMAKLISLDALALSESMTAGDPDVEEASRSLSITSAVDYFVTR